MTVLNVWKCISRMLEGNLFFFLLYRSPRISAASFLLEFEAFLLESEKITGDVVYLGDFNVWVDDKNNVYGRNF